MIGRGRLPPLFPKKLNSEAVACAWSQQIRLHNNFAKRLRGRTRNPIGLHAKLGLSLASFLSLVAVGRSLSQLSLDSTRESFAAPTQDNSRGRRQNVCDDPNVYVRNPRAYMRISEQTVCPGDHTGIARYDTAQLDSTPNRVMNFAVGVLPVPTGYWSIFSLISADNSESESESARPPVTGFHILARNSLVLDTEKHRSCCRWLACRRPQGRPVATKADIDEALRQALARLYDDLRPTTTTDARTVVPWTTLQAAGQAPSTLLAFFDSESRMLRIAKAGAGRAFLGRRVTVTGAGGHECQELTSSSGAQYFVNSDTHSNNARAMDVVEELIDGTCGSASPSRGEPDAASVKSVEVRDGDFLVLAMGSHNTWTCLDGNEAVQAVSGWLREQQEVASTSTQEEQRPARRGSWWPQDRFLDFPWSDTNHGLGFGFDWVHTMVPDLIRDVDKMFVGARGNAASRVLQLEHKYSRDGNSGNDQDFYATVRPGRSSPTPDSE